MQIRKASPLLIVTAILAVACWAAAILVISSDPYDMYSWGPQPSLRKVEYSGHSTLSLIDVVAHDKSIQTVMIGSSTSVGFTRVMLRPSDPSAAFNVSYSGARPYDRALVAKAISATHRQRVILILDWFYALPANTTTEPGFPLYMYNQDYLDDARTVGVPAIRLAVENLSRRPLWLPTWNFEKVQKRFEKDYRTFQSASTMQKLSRAIEAHRFEIGAPTNKTCASFTAVNSALVPLAKSLGSQGTSFDVLIPPYSLALYYDYLASPDKRMAAGATFTADQMLLRKCVVRALAALPRVRIFAFDDDLSLVGDLANYRDPGHIFPDRIYRNMMKSTENGTHRLTGQNVDAETGRLWHAILSYRLKNSRLGTATIQ